MMRYTSICLSVVAAIFLCGADRTAHAQAGVDRVRTARGAETGEITSMTPVAVTLSKGATSRSTVAMNEIRTIIFDGEPSELTQARVNVNNGGYVNALETLEKIDVSRIRRDFIQQDIEFYRAIAAARLALGGTGSIADAGRQLNAFVRSHPQNYHYLAAAEAMGDLLMASGNYASAEKQYAELAKAPWPEYKLRAAVLLGRSLQAQGKHSEAIRQFDTVLATRETGDSVKSQVLAATLAKAVSLADSGQVDEAVRTIEAVIRDADPEEKELHARAYNALGSCYEKGQQTKEALLAYLHVDVLYSTVPDAHAEALARLVPLWESIGQSERARESRQMLENRYAESRWAR